MKHINELKRRLVENFNWNKARIDCFAKMLLSLLATESVNLRKLAVAFDSDAEIDSRYKRLQRFLSGFDMEMNTIAQFIFSLFFSQEEKIYLTIDRTNWRWGKASINILTLGVAYEGNAIPLFWELLDNKGGNATGKQHAEMIRKFVALFGKDQIAAVLADREFANQDFFRWLTSNAIPFCIRVKEGAKVHIFSEKKWKIRRLFSHLQLKSQKTYIQPIYIHGQKLYAAAGKSATGELLVVVTNDISIYKNGTAVSVYLRRWEIENLFQSLKGRGFNFEDTHVTHFNRISKLMALISIGFCWAHKVGEYRALKKPIKLKIFSFGIRRPQYSYFRYGLDFMRDVILKIHRKQKVFLQCLAQAFSPPDLINNQLLEMQL